MGTANSFATNHEKPSFVFIKPHANTADARALVRADFAARGIAIIREGELTAQQIDEGALIDQHYYAIASKATISSQRSLRCRPRSLRRSLASSGTMRLPL